MSRLPAPAVPLGLVALSAVPLVAGALRLVELAGGPAVIPHDERLSASPAPVVAHVLGAAVYVLVGTLQFLPRFRRRHLRWHRRSGRMLAVAGLVVAGSALWMTLLYPAKPGTGTLLFGARLVFGTAMVAALVLGVRAARARDLRTHRAWMIRAYAIGLAAGTQVFTEGFGGALFGTGVVRDDLAKAAGWVVNLAVAEWLVHRPGRRVRSCWDLRGRRYRHRCRGRTGRPGPCPWRWPCPSGHLAPGRHGLRRRSGS